MNERMDEESSTQTGGIKHDTDKPRTDLLPVRPLQDIAEVLTHGAKRYGDRNWEKGLDWSRPYGAALRHLFAWWGGKNTDADSGKPHLACAATEILFLMEYAHSWAGYDDRPLVPGLVFETVVPTPIMRWRLANKAAVAPTIRSVRPDIIKSAWLRARRAP